MSNLYGQATYTIKGRVAEIYLNRTGGLALIHSLLAQGYVVVIKGGTK